MAHPLPVTISEYLVHSADLGLPEEGFSPFVESDALNETDLQKVSWDVAAGSCWLLFDLKGSLCYRKANTAVVSAKGLRGLSWSGELNYGVGSWGTFMIMGSVMTRKSESLCLRLHGLQRGTLDVTAGWMEFWTGQVSGADEAPPDYGDADHATIRAGLTDWSSPFQPLTRTVAQ